MSACNPSPIFSIVSNFSVIIGSKSGIGHSSVSYYSIGSISLSLEVLGESANS